MDTGFIVFNDRNYPNFERLLVELGVATQPGEHEPLGLRRAGGFEWASQPGRAVRERRAHLLDRRFHRMLLDLVRFFREARALV